MSSISVDYDVLNQKGSPAWYSDTYANIPIAGYKGRMFISIDTFAFYRDNGTGWDLVGGPDTGTITGAGISGQVTYFNGTDTIAGNNNFFWDITNSRLGIGTATPGSPLDIHSTGTNATFNGTTTNNAFVFFQNAGTSKWRIGNLYNSGSNDYQIYDVLNATARLTIKNTGATTLTGNFTATSLIKSGGTNLQILLADGTTTPTSTFGTGSVTSVSALTLGTTGTDLSSSVANSTTTPVITLNVPTASATNRGALSSADWTTFNNKQATITLTTTGTTGAATLIGATLNIPQYSGTGTVTSVAALTLGTTGTDLSSSVANSTTTPVITLNVPTASATNRGALSTTDWTTFNNKQATISVTAPVVLTGATISMPAATTSVSGYLTSTDWNTFNNKSNTNGTVTSVVALTIGTTGIDITSTAVTTTTTPVITLNIPTASASNRGALSSTDWTTFNNKQATLSLTTTGTSGAATLIANTLNIPQYSGGGGMAIGGSITSATAGSILYAGASGVLAQTNAQLFFDYTNNRLGVGTASPSYKLDVSGSSGAIARFTDGTTSSFIYSGSNVSCFGSDVNINNGMIINGGNNTIQHNTNGTERMRILSTGYIYFGGLPSVTTYVKYNFNLATNQQIGFRSSGGIATLESTNDAVAANVPMQFAASQYIFGSGGNVQMGSTTDAGYRLDVSGTFRTTGAATFGSTVSISGTGGLYYSLTTTLQSDAALFLNDGTYIAYAGLNVASNSNHYVIYYNGATRMAINATTGNLGIGTNTIGSKLQVNGGTAIGYSASTAAPTNGLQVNSRVNTNNSTDNALFSLSNAGTVNTLGLSCTATASSSTTLTITTGYTSWFYTGTGTATWTLPNPSGTNQIFWIKNAGTGIITLNAYSGTNIINNAGSSVSSITIAIGAKALIQQDGNVKSYQLQ